MINNEIEDAESSNKPQPTGCIDLSEKENEGKQTEDSTTKNKFDENNLPWNIDIVKAEILSAFEKNSEVDLLKVLKDNSFLFYDLYSRKYGIQPIFRELNFGTEYKCDFAWLNDNSSGPEWVLIEIEAPKMPLFKTNGKPTVKLYDAIEQVQSWEQYFEENKGEKTRIFGAVAQFRYILVTGTKEDWENENASRWRIQNGKRLKMEIRSMDTFMKSIKIAETDPGELWSFAEHPLTLSHSNLQDYWANYGYMDRWRKVID
ncbi:DUF4263 domain-containing protein [Mucilaginibacter sp. JRF]|uniref:Shedu anti-phage system protein SduA domain-containing protein n=1 Tax=Mucilaginibacter sp. JRF TaxID=2780088 RepID=UPI00187E5BC5|nr:Shedu anti-phage system protein SduA domain-containing protein [Mucilaginibacter sp. JRF]MBE9584291.1 DUF4263 domain-containing protein [Mucilaginibacter sp. JRF]